MILLLNRYYTQSSSLVSLSSSLSPFNTGIHFFFPYSNPIRTHSTANLPIIAPFFLPSPCVDSLNFHLHYQTFFPRPFATLASCASSSTEELRSFPLHPSHFLLEPRTLFIFSLSFSLCAHLPLKPFYSQFIEFCLLCFSEGLVSLGF